MDEEARMDDQLKQLYDYTKFHIGMYTTLMTAIIAVLANKDLAGKYADFLPFVLFSIPFFVFAGLFGGLVASSIPFFTTFKNFSEARLGPLNLKLIPSIWCTHLEHLMFWSGCVVAVGGLFWSVFH